MKRTMESTTLFLCLAGLIVLSPLACDDGDGDGGGEECVSGQKITATVSLPDSFPDLPDGIDFDGNAYMMAVSFYRDVAVPIEPMVDMPSALGGQTPDIDIAPGEDYDFVSDNQGGTEEGDSTDYSGEFYIAVALWLHEESYPIYAEWVWLSDKKYELQTGCNIDLGEIEMVRNGDVHQTKADEYQ